MLNEHINIYKDDNGNIVGELSVKFVCTAKTASSIGEKETNAIVNSAIHAEVKKFAACVLEEEAVYDSILKANVVDMDSGDLIQVMTCDMHIKKILEAIHDNKDKSVLK